MTWDKGFDFRDTDPFVTDPANCTWVTIADIYPTTRNSVTFGWVSGAGINTRDRSAGVDPRIAGIHFVTAGNTDNFRVDLPATGSYTIYLGCGDPTTSLIVGTHVVKDDATTLFTISHASAVNGLYDATDVDLTTANWASSNAGNTKTFATTIFKLTVGDASVISPIAHIFISQVSSGTLIDAPAIDSSEYMAAPMENVPY